MAASSKNMLPTLFPAPKQVIFLDGKSELALDVRLVTANVLPLQRKAIRSILTAAGVRVVANKKTYVVDVRVEPMETFDLKKVPVSCQRDYYEIILTGSEFVIRAPYQEGTVWGAQSLAAIFTWFQLHPEIVLPNLKICDWPVTAERGVYLKCGAMSDRMSITEWMALIDLLSLMKFNSLGIQVYSNTPSCRLNFPVPEHEDWRSVRHLEWYSSVHEMWSSDDFAPFLREREDLFLNVVAYGEEKGVHISPVMEVLGGCQYFSEMCAAYSGKDKKGKATGKDVCLSSKEGREFLAGVLANGLATLFPQGVENFQLQMQEHIGCQCKACAAKKENELVQDYMLWLADFLLKHQVRHVTMWNNGMLDSAFEKKLKKAGIADKVSILWYQTKDWKASAWKKSNQPTMCGLPAKFDLPGDERLKQMDQLAQLVEKNGLLGVTAGMIFRPLHLEAEALLGARCWEGIAGGTIQNVMDRWHENQFGGASPVLVSAQKLLREATVSSIYATCIPREEDTRKYPGDALAILEKTKKSKEYLADLEKKCATAAKELQAALEDETLKEIDRGNFRLLAAEATGVCAMAGGFVAMLEVRQELAKNAVVSQKLAPMIHAAKAELMAQLKVIELGAPLWMAPCQLHRGGKLLRFLDQLGTELQNQTGKKASSKIHWEII